VPIAEVNGARLHFRRAGRGEPLLLIAGFGVGKVAFAPIADLYTEHFDCIAFDNRGSGRSNLPAWPMSIPGLAADAVGLMDSLGIESAHVYGVSMGGMVAQEMAVRYPHRVRGLILGATTPGGVHAPRPELRAIWGLVEAMVSGHRYGNRIARLLFSTEFRRGNRAAVREYLLLLGAEPPTMRGLTWQFWASSLHDVESRLRRIHSPTLIIQGGADAMVPVRTAEVLADLIPDAEIAIVPGVGHLYFLEDPVGCRDLLVDWMQRRAPIMPGVPLTVGLSVVDAVSRKFALQLGAARAARTNVRLAGRLVNTAIAAAREPGPGPRTPAGSDS
jgi:3-oxoadipate enol-lactonase